MPDKNIKKCLLPNLLPNFDLLKLSVIPPMNTENIASTILPMPVKAPAATGVKPTESTRYAKITQPTIFIHAPPIKSIIP
jgi:hypothetical protein